ncbi:MAG: flagellar hook-length control protein FliK [Oscillospiraceae bacterium]|nr:flagellar hook-length control protein FliK [Oscillospiraceae bacterium]
MQVLQLAYNVQANRQASDAKGGERDKTRGMRDAFAEVLGGAQMSEGTRTAENKGASPPVSSNKNGKVRDEDVEMSGREEENTEAMRQQIFFSMFAQIKQPEAAPDAIIIPELTGIPGVTGGTADRTGSVISILEGNDISKDIKPRQIVGAVAEDAGDTPEPDGGADLEKLTFKDEVTARMPQRTREAAGDSGVPSPLENVNDPQPQIKTTEEKKAAKPEGEAVFVPGGDDGKTEEPSQPRVVPTQQIIDISPEKLQASEQLRSVQPESAATTENLFDKMVEKMEMSGGSGGNQLEIQLKPDYLGKVSIQLSATDGGLHARIKADDMAVKDLIGSQINQLIESLAGKGVKVSGIDVVYTGVSSQSFEQPGKGRGGEAEKSRKNSRADGKGDYGAVVADIPAQTPEIRDTEISSVEYRA